LVPTSNPGIGSVASVLVLGLYCIRFLRNAELLLANPRPIGTRDWNLKV
jgi:hypothetical protein